MALDFAAGCLGGCAGVLVGHPLDTIKVHLQTQNPKRPMYRGTWHCLKTIVARDSVRGLYRGMSSPMGGVAFVNAIVFGVYGNVQRNSSDPNSLLSHFVAGSTAGLIQSLVCSPMELAKTRLQLQENFRTTVRHKGPLSCLAHVHRTEGFRGLFRGLGITALRDVPGFSAYFVSYELMMGQIQTPTAFHSLLAGGCAGTISWLITFPMDVIKSCVQADGMTARPQYSGVVDCIRKGYHSEGIGFFCRGLTSTLLRAFPMNAACFFVVSLTMRLANGTHLQLELHPPDALVMLASSSVPVSSPHRHTNALNDIQHKRSHMIKSLMFLGAFSEAVCLSEVEELADEIYPVDSSEYYLFDSNRLPSECGASAGGR